MHRTEPRRRASLFPHVSEPQPVRLERQALDFATLARQFKDMVGRCDDVASEIAAQDGLAHGPRQALVEACHAFGDVLERLQLAATEYQGLLGAAQTPISTAAPYMA